MFFSTCIMWMFKIFSQLRFIFCSYIFLVLLALPMPSIWPPLVFADFFFPFGGSRSHRCGEKFNFSVLFHFFFFSVFIYRARWLLLAMVASGTRSGWQTNCKYFAFNLIIIYNLYAVSHLMQLDEKKRNVIRQSELCHANVIYTRSVEPTPT